MSDKMAMVSMKSLAPMGRAMTVAAMIAMLAGCGIIGGKKGGPELVGVFALQVDNHLAVELKLLHDPVRHPFERGFPA